MAEGILRRLLAEEGIDATVDSGGLYEGGAPATATAVEVLRDAGIDIREHRSRNLADIDPAGADLVIAMERRHIHEAVVLEPSLSARTFTLPELVRRSEEASPRGDGVALRDWAAGLTTERTAADLLGTDDAVADPIGQNRARYEETAELLFDLLQRFVERAWPAAIRGAA